MEAKPIFTAFVSSARQYFASPVEANYLNLQKHLDIVTALSSSSANSKIFDCHQLAVIESFTCLINIITNKFNETSLIQRVFAILSNLAKNEVFKALAFTFQLHSALSLFLEQYGSHVDMSDPLVYQCLGLLEASTEGVKIACVGEHMKNLINVLIVEINNKSSDISTLVLHILANLCRNNPAVQAHITGLDDLKKMYKSLVPKLRSPSKKTVIYALSIMASLRTSYLREKVFTSKELNDAFEMIVILFVTDESLSEAALNLFHDLVASQQTLQFFLNYPKIETAIRKIIDSFTDHTSLEQSTRLLKFIWFFTKNAESRSRAIKVLFAKSLGEEQSGEPPSRQLHLLLRKWATESYESSGEASLYAQRIIHAMVEVSNTEELSFFQPCFEKMVEKLLKNVLLSVKSTGCFSQQHLEMLTATFELLFLLLEKNILQDVIAQNIDISACQDLIKTQFEKNILCYDKNDWSASGVDLLLIVTIVLIHVRDCLPSASEFLSKLLQEQKLVSFLAYGISSTVPQRIQRSMYIWSTNSALQLSLLAEGVSAAVQNLLQTVKPQPHEGYSVSKSVSSQCSQRNLSKNIDCLVRRIESGIELAQLEESEILEVYRHRIVTLNHNMQELEALVDAKTVAMQQADKALAHYIRLEHQRNLEESKLQQLLEDSKRYSETTRKNLEKVKGELSKTQEELVLTFRDVTSLKEVKKEQEECIKQLNERIECLETEHNELNQLLKEKDSEIQELKKKCQGVEKALNEKIQEFDALEQHKEALLKQHEKDREKFKHELSLWEVVCGQRDTTIKELEAQIKTLTLQNNELTEELEQHKYITKMIHQMSSKSMKRDPKE